MSKAKLLLAACFATFAFSALASASAPASGWDVNGTLLVGTKALASTALVLANGKFAFTEVEVECTGHELLIKNGFIRHPDEILAEDLTFHGCKIVGAAEANCSLSSTLILTLSIHGLAELDTKGNSLNTLILILPLPSKTFAVLKFEGEKCVMSGTQPVISTKNPAIDLLIDDGSVSSVLHLVLAFSLPESLRLGSSSATLLEVDADIGLASGEPWNFL